MKTTTARLLKLREAGHTITVSAPPYAGHAVTYVPRNKYDPKPWTCGMFRYSAGELHAVEPSRPVSTAYAANTERANADLADVVFEGDRVPAVYVAAGAAPMVAMGHPTRVKYVLRDARKAGFIATRYHMGATGTTQFNRDNGDVLMVTFVEGVFVTARGYGWGDAPWTDTPWDTYDHGTFLRMINT